MKKSAQNSRQAMFNQPIRAGGHNFVPGGQLGTWKFGNNHTTLGANRPELLQHPINIQTKPPNAVQSLEVAQQPKIVHHNLNLADKPNVSVMYQQSPDVLSSSNDNNLMSKKENLNKPFRTNVQELMEHGNAETQASVLTAEGAAMDITPVLTETKMQMPSWKTKVKGKVNKLDRIKKRNKQLKKILFPKNASMVLNELVGSLPTIVEEKVSYANDEKYFCASITYDSLVHRGCGKNKALAKSAAAEAVIRHLFLKRMSKYDDDPVQQKLKTELLIGNKDELMEEEDEDDDDKTLFSWSHIASFALHKLISSWDEDDKITSRIDDNRDALSSTAGTSSSETCPIIKVELKPARNIPPNASSINPVMLIHQMCPKPVFKENPTIGSPPNILFSVNCTVENQEFTGCGPNKKTARKIAAYKACQSILKIEYPDNVLAEISLYNSI